MTRLDNAIEELKACLPAVLILAFVIACGYLSQAFDEPAASGTIAARSNK